MERFRPTPEQCAWLAQAYRVDRLPALTARFNRRWGTAYSATQIKAALTRRGIQSGRPPGLAAGERRPFWTDDKIAWLRQHRASASIGEIVERFNRRFGTRCEVHNVANACKRFGIETGRTGYFEPGARPWNAGAKGYNAGGRSVETRFKPGQESWRNMPVGAYRQDSNGHWLLKVRDDAPPGLSRRNWCDVHRLTWEAERGPVPRGHVVVFLDGDQNNCLDAANLDCIPRAVLARLAQMGWGELTDLDARRAMLAAAKLKQAAHDRARDLGLTHTERARLLGPGASFKSREASAP